MNKHAFLIPLFLFLCCHIYSQETIKQRSIQGFVKDSIGEPYENVIIVIEGYQGNTLSFGQTDIKGMFAINYKTDQDSISLKFRRIGMKTVVKKLSVNEKEINVIMEVSSDNYLKEVVIRSKRPVESFGDTISYNPRYFKDGTEKNVEEILAKLPGVSVDASTGKIKYQGQEIKKILLDGDDLTGNNYKVLSKNLSAEWIEDVQIIKKFNNKRLLRGIKQSDDIAINLKLSENAKAPIFGKLNISGGIESKYAIKTELLSYQKKIKLFSIAETNNIGSDLETSDFETYLIIQEGVKDFLSASKLLNNSLLPPEYFKSENFNFQLGFFYSTALVFKPTEKLRVKSLTNFYDNNLRYIFTDSLSYFLPDGLNLSVSEIQNQLQRPQEFFEDLNLDFFLKENQDLNLMIQFKKIRSKINSRNSTIFRDVSQAEIQNQDKFFSKLLYTNKINQKWALETELNIAFDAMEEKLVISDQNDSSNEITTNLNQNYFDFGGAIKLYGKLSDNTFLNSFTGWNQSKSNFKKLFDSAYNFDNFYTELEYKKTFNKLSLSSSARLRNVDITLNKQKSNKTLFEPLLGLSYQDYFFNFLEFKVKTLISIENEFINPIQLFKDDTFIDYRTIVSYNADFKKPIKSNIAFLSAKFTDNQKTFLSVNFEMGFEKTDNDLVPFITFEDDIVKTNYIQMRNTESFNTSINLDRYFSKIKTNIGLSISNQLKESFQSIEGIFSQNNLVSKQIKVNAGIVATKKLNISSSFAYNQTSNKWLGVENNFSYKNYFFKWVYKINSNLKFSNDFQVVDFENSFGGTSAISNLNLTQNLNNKLSFSYSLTNIFNQDKISISQSNTSFFSTSKYPIQSRFFLITATYKF